MQVPVSRIRDPKRISALLSLEPERTAILAAFLGTFGPGDGAWAWRAGGATNISFVVHLTRSPRSPILFGYGPPAGTENLLAAALPELPERLLLHFPAADREALARVFTMDVASHTVFSLVRGDPAGPDRMGKGARTTEQEREEAAPVVSREYRTAFLERVATPAEGRPAATAAARHAALARSLFDEGVETIGTVVRDDDDAGRARLATLGYVAQGHVLIGIGVLRGARRRGLSRAS